MTHEEGEGTMAWSRVRGQVVLACVTNLQDEAQGAGAGDDLCDLLAELGPWLVGLLVGPQKPRVGLRSCLGRDREWIGHLPMRGGRRYGGLVPGARIQRERRATVRQFLRGVGEGWSSLSARGSADTQPIGRGLQTDVTHRFPHGVPDGAATAGSRAPHGDSGRAAHGGPGHGRAFRGVYEYCIRGGRRVD
jgi:hypothetical protein